jgi:hypothetical protein
VGSRKERRDSPENSAAQRVAAGPWEEFIESKKCITVNL